MKGPFGISGPKRRRVSMQLGYDVRPSLWQAIKSNSHLVIAAVGTVALVGVAGSALWLAMPDGDRRAFAQVEKPASTANAEQPASGNETATTAPVADGVASAAAPALSAQDPRWKAPGSKRTAENKAIQEIQKEAGTPLIPTPEQAATVAAYQAAMDAPATGKNKAHTGTDKAETAAIPTPKPAMPEAGDAADGNTGDSDHAGENGHILRAVTMRSGPKKGASAITTIPAKAAVQVMSCKSWCEVEYKGQRGWIYKSFLKRG